jgi:hypothetical protein
MKQEEILLSALLRARGRMFLLAYKTVGMLAILIWWPVANILVLVVMDSLKALRFVTTECGMDFLDTVCAHAMVSAVDREILVVLIRGAPSAIHAATTSAHLVGRKAKFAAVLMRGQRLAALAWNAIQDRVFPDDRRRNSVEK